MNMWLVMIVNQRTMMMIIILHICRQLEKVCQYIAMHW